jgi:dihydropteroate synthase
VAQTSAATLAVMARANLVRSHEVPRVQPVLNLQDFA